MRERQKMWVTKDDGMWCAGCQCCGSLIFEDVDWRRVFNAAVHHADCRHTWKFL